MQRDCNVEMNQSKEMIESKNKQLKVLKDQVDNLNIENDEIRKACDAKNVEVMLMIEVIEGEEKLENENKTLKIKVLDVEEKLRS